MNKELQHYIANRIIIDLESYCWEWAKAKHTHGYGKCSKFWNVYKKSLAHQLSYIAFNGVYPKELHVLHKCHNRKCCNPEHLYLGTQKDNMLDRISDGTVPKGSNHWNSKLTEENVRVIKSLLNTTTQTALAKTFNVNRSTIADIKAGRTWRDIAC